MPASASAPSTDTSPRATRSSRRCTATRSTSSASAPTSCWRPSPPDQALAEWMQLFVRHVATKRGMLSVLKPMLSSNPSFSAQTRGRAHSGRDEAPRRPALPPARSGPTSTAPTCSAPSAASACRPTRSAPRRPSASSGCSSTASATGRSTHQRPADGRRLRLKRRIPGCRLRARSRPSRIRSSPNLEFVRIVIAGLHVCPNAIAARCG